MTSNAATRHVWEQFLNVGDGRAPNPSPPELGLRMARLRAAIRESTARGGAVIAVPTATTPIVPIAGGPTAPVLPAPTLAEAVS